jgi:hypothetical protein
MTPPAENPPFQTIPLDGTDSNLQLLVSKPSFLPTID